MHKVYYLHTRVEPGTQWLPYSRLHFQIRFLFWISLYSDSNYIAFVPKGQRKEKTALVQIMAYVIRPGLVIQIIHHHHHNRRHTPHTYTPTPPLSPPSHDMTHE